MGCWRYGSPFRVRGATHERDETLGDLENTSVRYSIWTDVLLTFRPFARIRHVEPRRPTRSRCALPAASATVALLVTQRFFASLPMKTPYSSNFAFRTLSFCLRLANVKALIWA